MIKVFQDRFGQGYGNCFSATTASLFHKKLEEVPVFVDHYEDGTWFKLYWQFLQEQGYEYNGWVENTKQLGFCGENKMESIKDMEGVDGFFEATVYSPGLFNKMEYIFNPNYKAPTHAVIIDKDFNIVHDPHPHYQGVKQYPLHEFLGYNGVLNFYILEKIKENNGEGN